MKKSGILNADIAAVVARLGHMDRISVGDAGLPIPDGPQRIDLVVRPGLPSFLDVVDMLMTEMVIEHAIIAQEMRTTSPHIHQQLLKRLDGVRITTVAHTEFKVQTAQSKAVIRTGEFTPYANVILVAGVAF